MANAPAKRKTATKRTTRRTLKPPIVIDVHTHVVVPEVFKETASHALNARIGLPDATNMSTAGGGQETDVELMTGLDTRIRDMNKMGIDIQIISPSIVHQCAYWAEPKKGLALDKLGNDRIAEIVAQYPDRLAGMCCVPLQDPRAAARELERSVKRLRLKGVEISSHVNDWELGDKNLWPFWRKAESLGVPVFIHPAGNSDPRLRKYAFAYTIGQPWEEVLAISSLVFEGVMDKFPKLKIMVGHGGGYLPYYAGRLDNGYRNAKRNKRPTRLKRDLSGYLKKFYYDNVIFNTDMLEFLAAKATPKHIMMGTDYPYAERRPVQFVRSSKKLSRADQDAILGGNAARLFNIPV
jgi:aminocarboxymuconate-semialdehyde decarboxylase